MRKRLLGWATALVTVLTLNLGCMGLVNSMTDIDLDMAMAEDAVHPADFPVGPPAAGTKTLSMGVTADADTLNLPVEVKVELPPGTSYRMQMISYDHPDPNSELPAAQAALEADGWTLNPQTDTPEANIYTKGPAYFLVVAAESDDTWTLIRLQPKLPEASETD